MARLIVPTLASLIAVGASPVHAESAAPKTATPQTTITKTTPVTQPKKKKSRRAELRVSAHAGGGGSTWRGDGFGYTALHIGVRGWNLVSLYANIRFGFAKVDQRFVTVLSLGAKIWAPRLWKLRPFFRIAGVHSHEEPLPSVRKNPAGVLVGIGDGIRHRAGVDMGLGVDIDLKHWPKRKLKLYLAAEFQTAWLKYSSGPTWYFSGNLGLGINYSL